MCVSAVALLFLVAGSPEESQQRLDAAREHVQKGRIAEALEVYEELSDTGVAPAATAIGLSRALTAVGRLTEATQRLAAAVEASGNDPELLAHLARVQFDQGQFQSAEETAGRALRGDDQQPLARLVLADVLTETGRLDEANEAYRWFVRFYNRAQPEDAETLLIVARGAVNYARWNGSSQIFDFVVNTLCPDVLAADSLSWQAHQLCGSLLLEKYNREQALPEFRKALAINPRAATVLVSLADAALQRRDFETAESFVDRALGINPAFCPGLQLKADILLAKGEIVAARKELDDALLVDPHDQSTLARVVACELLSEGAPPLDVLLEALNGENAAASQGGETAEPLITLVRELSQRNPRPGEFLTRLGLLLESRRRYAAAEVFYQRAITLMPQLAEPKTALGLLYMRVGKTDEAQRLLDDAFEADPFHVRVSNMRKVIALLDEYDTISTDHFVIHVDSAADRILGRYMAEYLEEIYPELVEQFGYEPPQRTQFEIYHNAKGLSAHQWFSARMVGLPWIQTIGASTGVVVALASPTASASPFNWARVLKHEFVHVITLQQTHFNIPHWFTEALAVTSEGGTRSAEWNRLLLERVPAGDLFALEALDGVFARPASPEDWQFAYCLSRIYAQYMVEAHGADCIRDLLDAYRRNLSTAQAIQNVFGVDQATFEAGYRAYLEELVSKLRAGEVDGSSTLAELEAAHLTDPRDPDSRAAFAYGLHRAGRTERAEQLATDALQADARTPLAAVVLSDVKLASEDVAGARRLLSDALDSRRPDSRVLSRLARLEFDNRDYTRAAELHELGRRHFPNDPQWLGGLAAAYWKLGDRTRLKQVLSELALRAPNDASVRKKRAQLAFEEQDFAAAIQYGRWALHIDVLDADVHRLLGKAYRETGQLQLAVQEFETAVECKPDDARLELELARTYIDAERSDAARRLLQKIVKQRPRHAAARRLLEELD